MVGRTISHYEIVEKLGEGGMGVVYKARDTHLDRFVAIKVLPPEKVADAERKRRFVQEAKSASALNHPNIITIYDIASDNGIEFIAMEYVAGKALNQLIARKGLPLGEALKYAVQIADALAAAHSAGIIHRDLKPGNVMVGGAPERAGFIKVLDFGLAKLTDQLERSERESTDTMRQEDAPGTGEGTIVGTVSYMSPEQAEGKKVDARSDIFSFGALLYEMVTGRRAFHGDSKLSTLSAILREEPKLASQVVQGLPRELERIIARCLRKSPERRFQTMADLKVAIEELKEESDSGTLNPAPASKRRSGRRLAWAIAVPVIITVGGGTLWFVRSTSKAPEAAFTAVPLTTYSGFQTEPSFSPDGSQVAFTWDGEKRDNSDIYVKVVGTAGQPLRLTTDPAVDSSPAWSPDGRFVAFVRSTQEKSEARLIPALGWPERKLAETRDVWNLAWSPHSRSLVYRILAFTRSISLEVGDLFQLASSDDFKTSGEVRQMTFDKHATNAAWTPDGHKIVFSSSMVSPRTGLWSIAVSSPTGPTSKPQKLVSLGEGLFNPTISHTGGRLAYAHVFVHASIWRTAVPGDRIRSDSTSVKPARGGAAFISSTRNDSQPQFSPDGRSIAFVSARTGSPEIWLCRSDGSSAVQLTSFGGPEITSPHWSPDGGRIVFDSTADGKLDVYMISASGGKPRRLTTDSSNNGNPSWSGDGRWIYFDSSRSGNQQVWKIPASGGPAIQITSESAWVPIESPDRKYLYYFNGAGSTSSLWKMPLSGGQATKVLDNVSNWNIAFAENGIYFARYHSSQGASIHYLGFSANQVRSIATLDKSVGLGGANGLAVSPDGRWLLYTLLDQAGSELMLVENFH
jgi:serine/threonine protein kinase/Tol biopolymer transport system component